MDASAALPPVAPKATLAHEIRQIRRAARSVPAWGEVGVTYRLTDGDLRKAFDPQTLRRGRGVHVHKRVRRVEASADGLRITGSVQGSERRPYDQTVSLVPVRGGTGVRVSGYCTCPVAVNCKHVVAVLLEHCNRLRQKEGLFLAAQSDGQGTAAASQPAQLPAAVTEWIDRLGAAVAPVSKTQSGYKPNQRELRFVLNPRDALPGDGSARRADSGGQRQAQEGRQLLRREALRSQRRIHAKGKPSAVPDCGQSRHSRRPCLAGARIESRQQRRRTAWGGCRQPARP